MENENNKNNETETMNVQGVHSQGERTISIVHHAHKHYYGNSGNDKKQGSITKFIAENPGTTVLLGLSLGAAATYITKSIVERNLAISASNKEKLAIDLVNSLKLIDDKSEHNTEIIETIPFEYNKTKKCIIYRINNSEDRYIFNKEFRNGGNIETPYLVTIIEPKNENNKTLMIYSKNNTLSRRTIKDVIYVEPEKYRKLDLYNLVIELGFDIEKDNICYIEESKLESDALGIASYFKREDAKETDKYANIIFNLKEINGRELVFKYLKSEIFLEANKVDCDRLYN